MVASFEEAWHLLDDKSAVEADGTADAELYRG